MTDLPPEISNLLVEIDVAERLRLIRLTATALIMALKGADLERDAAGALSELAREVRSDLDELASEIEQERGKRLMLGVQP
jgi:hypothetical protein